MSQQAEEIQKKKQGCMFNALLIFTFVVLAFVIFYFAIWRVPGSEKEAVVLREKLQEKADVAMAVPADKNAWTKYKEAMDLFVKFNDLKEVKNLKAKNTNVPAVHKILDNGLKKVHIPLVKAWIKANEKCIAKCREGYNLSHFQVPFDYRKHFNAKLPDLIKLRSMVQFLNIAAMEKAKQGDYNTAADYHLYCLKIGQKMGKNAPLICGMISIAVDGITLPPLNDLINNNDLDKSIYKRITTQMLRLKKGAFDFKDMMNGEFLTVEYGLKAIMDGGAASAGLNIPGYVRLLPVKAYVRRERKIFRIYHMKTLKELDGSYDHELKALKPPKLPPLTYINSILRPDYKKVYVIFHAYRTRYNGVMTAAALKWYQKEHNKYPDSLDKLVPDYLPELPEDPFTPGNKFVYKKTADGILMYSYGPDKADNKAGSQWKQYGDAGDLIFMKPKKGK